VTTQRKKRDEARARLKSAELLSATGALVLGIGLGTALSSYVGSLAAPLLLAGIASHGFGMLLKHRLEAKQRQTPAAWETALYWVCWVALAGVLLLTGINAIRG
jgi:hypothetical protein